jgi:lipoyl-dependent peroxiredoxin
LEAGRRGDADVVIISAKRCQLFAVQSPRWPLDRGLDVRSAKMGTVPQRLIAAIGNPAAAGTISCRQGDEHDQKGEGRLARHRSCRQRVSYGDSGVLAETPYSFRTRFENEKGTNPEELIAAAHAGCFIMALAFGLQSAGLTPTELSTEAAVTLEPEGQGFRISRSALTLRAKVPNVDEATLARLAGEAEKNCPVSKMLKAEITLDAKLIR